jgi:hypothetical protein
VAAQGLRECCRLCECIAIRHSSEEAHMDRVLFACRHNAGRSQVAAAFFNRK